MLTLEKIIEAQTCLYTECKFNFTNLIPEIENKMYFAHYYQVNNKHVRFRIAKKTPSKTGRFVTIWKRVDSGIIAPYAQTDDIDFLVINISHEDKIGQFVFPKTVLIAKDILSKNGKGGKLAFRIYSPWDEVNSPQAKRTKIWQAKYFIEITLNTSTDIKSIKDLYTNH